MLRKQPQGRFRSFELTLSPVLRGKFKQKARIVLRRGVGQGSARFLMTAKPCKASRPAQAPLDVVGMSRDFGGVDIYLQ